MRSSIAGPGSRPACRPFLTRILPTASPTICPRSNGARRASRFTRSRSRCRPRNRCGTWSCPPASRPASSRPSPKSTSPFAWRGTSADGSISPRALTIPISRNGRARAATGSRSARTPISDGRADSFKVFAEGLNIPTSILPASGGVIVLQAPDTLFLKDTDGDGRADIRKVLFTGWGIRDTHAGPSNLRWGFDNWVWGIVGYSGFRGTVGGENVQFGPACTASNPMGRSSNFSVAPATTRGVWASARMAWFSARRPMAAPASTCRSPTDIYEAVRGLAPRELASIAASNRFYPVTDKVRQVDWHGGFTAAAGHALYTARTYPRHYWNQTAFVAEPTGHLVATFTLHRKGSDVSSYYGWNLLASDDEWTAPINAEVGPDGNVWVIDWYNYIVQHNPTPIGFKTGKGNAYETPLRDKTHGRIYRVVTSARPEMSSMTLDAG